MMLYLYALIMGTTSSRAEIASYYTEGSRTASGERYDPNKLTAAHKKLPFGTKVKVTNIHNGKEVIVRINDRGPFVRNRDLDLSLGAAQKIDMIGAGVIKIKMEIMENERSYVSSISKSGIFSWGTNPNLYSGGGITQDRCRGKS
jgi:rare lipoprotein A